MELTLATPALLFPAASLLLLVYANRFLAVARLIRELHAEYKVRPNQKLVEQIGTLRKRLFLIRNMQILAIVSFFLCVLCMFILFSGNVLIAKCIFVLSLIFFLGSLTFSLREILLSVKALDLHLQDLKRNT